MAKYYFEHEEAENCYSLEAIKDRMRFNGVKELTVIEAERNTGDGYFWCKHFNFGGEVGEGCGILCSAYKPRNGKRGRCIHSGYTYDFTDNKITIKL